MVSQDWYHFSSNFMPNILYVKISMLAINDHKDAMQHFFNVPLIIVSVNPLMTALSSGSSSFWRSFSNSASSAFRFSSSSCSLVFSSLV